MNLFEKTTDFFQNIISKCTNYINKVTKLQEEQQKRITPKFNEEENICLDNNISLYIMDITEKIKKCDELIKQLSCIKLVSLSENDMKNNMKIYLASKLQEISKKIRQNEEEYMNKYKEFGKNDFKQVYNSDTLNEAHPKPNSFLELNKSNDILRQRDNEINNIVRSISDLTQIFNDLGVLVKDQGTILDRIDFNIELSLENTKKANFQLKKTEKNLKENYARNSIMILIIIIFIEALLLLFKFSK